MKFPHLPMGQRFYFQGEPYVKTGPLTARREQDGSSRMIPRSAMVTLDTPGRPGGSQSWWTDALDVYEQTLRDTLTPKGGRRDLGLATRLDQAIGAARAGFIRAAAAHEGDRVD